MLCADSRGLSRQGFYRAMRCVALGQKGMDMNNHIAPNHFSGTAAVPSSPALPAHSSSSCWSPRAPECAAAATAGPGRRTRGDASANPGCPACAHPGTLLTLILIASPRSTALRLESASAHPHVYHRPPPPLRPRRWLPHPHPHPHPHRSRRLVRTGPSRPRSACATRRRSHGPTPISTASSPATRRASCSRARSCRSPTCARSGRYPTRCVERALRLGPFRSMFTPLLTGR